MNNIPYPYIPIENINIQNQLNKIYEELKKINEKIENIENKEINKYLKKNDNYHMI